MRRPTSVLPAVVFALLLAVAPAAAKSTVQVSIRSLSYDPSTVSLVAQGTTVRWLNVTSPNRVHDVVGSLTGYFETSLLSSGQSFQKRFTAAGTFTYICSIHDVMLGAITVPLVAQTVVIDGVIHFQLRLGTAPWRKADAYRYVLLRQGPGAPGLSVWRVVRHDLIDFVPEVAGEYRFAARLKDRLANRASANSAEVTLSYAP